jgi:hypothetical protein
MIKRLFGTVNRSDLTEPSWREVLASPDEQQSAGAYWREIVAASGASGTPARSHTVLRLVPAYVVFDRASAAVMRAGSPVDPHAWAVQLAASQLASQIEGDLGLFPRRRVR